MTSMPIDPRDLRQDGGLDLPPGFRAIALRERGDAFVEAQRLAPEAGAATLVWVRRFDTVEFAVVLEPDETLPGARRALYACMNAAADALSAHGPPEKPIAFSWPDTILFDGGILGGARLASAPGAIDGAIPDWLVVGFVIRSVVALAPTHDPAGKLVGHILDQPMVRGTSLEGEGFQMMDAGQLIESFARHLMVYVDQWQEKGFVPVGQQFLARLPTVRGAKHGIDINGDLLVRNVATPAKVERQPLAEALATPQWLDPETGDPWL
jgi:Biotin/lipoate A/B protein ligase family